MADTFHLQTSAEVSEAGDDESVKVLILIPSLAVGGAETDLVRVLPRLDHSRFKVVVCAFQDRGPLAEKLLDADIEIIGPFAASRGRLQSLGRLLRRSIEFQRAMSAGRPWLAHVLAAAAFLVKSILTPLLQLTSGMRYHWRVVRPVARYIRDADIDVVHTILPNAYLAGAFASFFAQRRPLVMSRVSLNWYQKDYRLVSILERYLLHRFVDCAIGNSKAILQELRAEGVADSKLQLVYNGIDTAAFANEFVERDRARDRLGIAPDTLVITMVANLFPYKGHADLLKSLRLFQDLQPPDWVLLVVGRDIDGRLAALVRQSDELGLAKNVRFLGQRDDIALILSAADIHVSASHHEGFPNNIVEAMCAGLPVVATAVGGIPELVVDGQTGLLVPAQESGPMADALYRLAHDVDRRKALGAAGRTRIETHFTIDRCVAAFSEIYARLAMKRHHPERRRAAAAIAPAGRAIRQDRCHQHGQPGRGSRRMAGFRRRWRNPPAERNVLIWWGALDDGGGATIGDQHAIENLSAELQSRGFEHVIASTLPLAERFQSLARDPRMLPAKLETITFVCGPIMDSQQLRALLASHAARSKLAVGVSVLASQAAMNARFDAVCPRDGGRGATFDLSAARFNNVAAPPPIPGGPIALCLLGSPSQLPLHEKAERLLRAAAERTGAPITQIDTVIAPGANDAERIERQFAAAGLIATTRLHGALYALMHARPVIAIDQVEGGSKVSAALERIGWPLVFRADQVTASEIEDAFAMARSPEIVPVVERCRTDAIARSVDALKQAADMVVGIGRPPASIWRRLVGLPPQSPASGRIVSSPAGSE